MAPVLPSRARSASACRTHSSRPPTWTAPHYSIDWLTRNAAPARVSCGPSDACFPACARGARQHCAVDSRPGPSASGAAGHSGGSRACPASGAAKCCVHACRHTASRSADTQTHWHSGRHPPPFAPAATAPADPPCWRSPRVWAPTCPMSRTGHRCVPPAQTAAAPSPGLASRPCTATPS